MTIKERLESDGVDALKSKNKVKLGVIRMVRSQIKNSEIAKRRDLTDDETIDVLVSAVKARREALVFANVGQREDLAQEAQQDIEILEAYLPEAMPEDELRSIVDNAIRDSGASGIKDMGQVMGKVMPQVKGKADGKQINVMVRSLLQDLS